MKHLLYFLIVLTVNSYAQSKDNSKEFIKKSYLAIEYNYRSYGKNDHVGNGVSIEFSRGFNKWISAGINIGYWQDEKLFWDFVNPFNGNRFIYPERIQDFKILPFVQFFPLKTKIVDFYLQTGLRASYINQVMYEGGFNTSFSLETFTVNLKDVGQKQFILGYEFGFGLLFKINNFTIAPNTTLYSNDKDGNSFSALNLKIGWNFN